MTKSKKVESIIRDFNFLKLNKSIVKLSKLTKSELEPFTQKYPALIIFIFRILNTEDKKDFIGKLSTTSINYLIEEDLRMLVLKEISKNSDNLKIYSILFSYFETFMVSECNPDNILFKDIKIVLEELEQSKNRDKSNQFSYLDVLSSEELKPILSYIIDYNINIALGIILFSSNFISDTLLNIFIERKERKILQTLPPSILERKNIRNLLHANPDLDETEVLPEILKQKWQKLANVTSKYEMFFYYLNFLVKDQACEKFRYSVYRPVLMKKVYKRIKAIKYHEREILLDEIRSRDYLNSQDIDILKTTLS